MEYCTISRRPWLGGYVVTPHPLLWRNVEDIDDWDARIRQAGIQRILTHGVSAWLEPEILNCSNDGLSWIVGGVCRKLARRLQVDSWGRWARAAVHACSTLGPADVDVILATGSPFAAFSVTKRLADRLGRPYVLDYRDPWTGNPHGEDSDRLSIVRKEKRLLAGSAAITIVSPSWASALSRRFGVGEKLYVVTNGYDPMELRNVKPYEFGHFSVVYTGSFYPPKRVISPVMSALNLLNKTNSKDEWRFHYYGDHAAHVSAEAMRAGVMERVVIHRTVPRSEALSAIRGSNITVVITTIDDTASLEDKGIVPGKLFESIGMGRPTIVIAPPGSDVQTIAETSGIARRFSGNDPSGIASFISEAMRDRIPPSTSYDGYAWTTIAKRLDGILRVAAGHHSHMTMAKFTAGQTATALF